MGITTSTAQNDVTDGSLVIPLISNPRYQFQTDLDGAAYEFKIRWNVTDQGWYFDIKGISNDVDYAGIRMSTGPNLLKPYAILELGGLYIIDVEEEGLDPDFDEIGSRYLMYYVDKDNVDEII